MDLTKFYVVQRDPATEVHDSVRWSDPIKNGRMTDDGLIAGKHIRLIKCARIDISSGEN
jgi:hypothetical protein